MTTVASCCLDRRDGLPCDCLPLAPLRLSLRGQRLLAALLLALTAAGLLACFVIGQQRRCNALRADHNPLAATYCPANPQEPRT